MKIAFRTDASLQIGTGHVMRCLTLADVLRERGHDCVFICRAHEGNLLALITQRGYQSVALPKAENDILLSFSELDSMHAAWLGVCWERDVEDTKQVLKGHMVDWLVIDHYALDHRWELALRPYCKQLMVIDDLADRKHDCDLLVDQNLGRHVGDYQNLISSAAVCLAGSNYALLRSEFVASRKDSLARRVKPELKQLLITMGGVDKDNVTGRVLEAIHKCPSLPDMNITVVMGPHAPWLQHVQVTATQMKHAVQVLVGVGDMARLMVESDLAIGAAGATSWERCCLGVPTIIFVLADNQREVAAGLENAGAAVILEQKDLDIQLPDLLLSLQICPDRLVEMSMAAASIIDGRGISAVIQELESVY